MQLSPQLETIFSGVPVSEALSGLSRFGFKGFEITFLQNYDINELKEKVDEFSLELVNFVNPVINITAKEQKNLFLDNLERSIQAAELLKCKRITVLPGDCTSDSVTEQRDNLCNALEAASKRLEGSEITVLVEATNRRVNRPNSFLVYADDAFSIIKDVNSPNVRMLYSIYHQQISEGDLLARIVPNIELIGHFHAAGVPKRMELQYSEINYAYIFDMIRALGYEKWIGLDYHPSEDISVGLEYALSLLKT